MPKKFAFLLFSLVFFSTSLHSKSRSTTLNLEPLYVNMVKYEPVRLSPVQHKSKYPITNNIKLALETIGCK